MLESLKNINNSFANIESIFSSLETRLSDTLSLLTIVINNIHFTELLNHPQDLQLKYTRNLGG